MSDDVFENALVAAQEPSSSPTRHDLLQKLSELVFDGRAPEPSSYLSALWEEGTIEEIKQQIARYTLPKDPKNDVLEIAAQDITVPESYVTKAMPTTNFRPTRYNAQGIVIRETYDPQEWRQVSGGLQRIKPVSDHSDPGDEDDKVRVFAETVVLKSYKLPLPQIDERIARSLGWVSPDDHNQRVTELLNANNALVERRRIAEQRQREAEALIKSLRDFLSDPVRAVLLAEIERLVSGT